MALRLVQTSEKTLEKKTTTLAVYEEWLQATGRTAGLSRLSSEREALIARWVAQYGEEAVMLACWGCGASKWHTENMRNDLSDVMKNPAQFERFAELGHQMLRRAQAQVREAEAAQREGVGRPDAHVASGVPAPATRSEIPAAVRARMSAIRAGILGTAR